MQAISAGDFDAMYFGISPAVDALQRVRSNARNLRAQQPDAEILIIVNADGIPAALETRDPKTDAGPRIYKNTLHSRRLVAPTRILPIPATVEILAQLQIYGWLYIRA